MRSTPYNCDSKHKHPEMKKIEFFGCHTKLWVERRFLEHEIASTEKCPKIEVCVCVSPLPIFFSASPLFCSPPLLSSSVLLLLCSPPLLCSSVPLSSSVLLFHSALLLCSPPMFPSAFLSLVCSSPLLCSFALLSSSVLRLCSVLWLYLLLVLFVFVWIFGIVKIYPFCVLPLIMAIPSTNILK